MMGNPNYCPKKLGPSPIINQFEGTEEEICAYNFAISQQVRILCSYLLSK